MFLFWTTSRNLIKGWEYSLSGIGKSIMSQAVAADRSQAPGDQWQCQSCTYVHDDDKERDFLNCAVCGEKRPHDRTAEREQPHRQQTNGGGRSRSSTAAQQPSPQPPPQQRQQMAVAGQTVLPAHVAPGPSGSTSDSVNAEAHPGGHKRPPPQAPPVRAGGGGGKRGRTSPQAGVRSSGSGGGDAASSTSNRAGKQAMRSDGGAAAATAVASGGMNYKVCQTAVKFNKV